MQLNMARVAPEATVPNGQPVGGRKGIQQRINVLNQPLMAPGIDCVILEVTLARLRLRFVPVKVRIVARLG